ncbi:MAG TPA: hypothetical protein VFM98_08810 [Ramlibacter sp.]|uniref:hypothetical protein n=1 Tax=Ramlibacter sp. TaxID=1917967 RepID=UPI002D7F8706|nr:hypothetical protein [Ramlibacter sp.]HET8745693.1 hypothetical protein [Ramlibacter sp.]
MSVPTTKTEILARVAHLDRMLANKRATLASQQDERRALVDSCHTHGGHVPEYSHDGSKTASGAFTTSGFRYCCHFCACVLTTSDEQRARGLTRG